MKFRENIEKFSLLRPDLKGMKHCKS